MGLFSCKTKGCTVSGIHRTCFIGGTRGTVFLDAKAINEYEKIIERNIITGRDKYKGVPKEHQVMFHTFAEQKRAERAAEQRTRGKKS